MSTTGVDTSTVRRWKPYPEYWRAGLDWLAEIPSHWQILPLKRRVRIRYGLGQPPESMPEGLPLIRATNVKRGRITDEGMMYVDPADVPTSRDAVLRTGDIIVVRSGAYTGDSAIIPHEYAGAIAGYDMVVRSSKDHSPYLGWQLISPEVEDYQFQLVKLRAAQPHLNAEELGETIVCVPPIPEQRAIAAFLDRETARIDALIGHKERLIALLEEKQQAVISHAVMHGLDPDAPLKDSGVPWLGMVTEHWNVSRTKFVARLESGHTPSRQHAEYWENCTIPWFTLADVWQLREGWQEYVSETEEKVSELGIANSAARLLPAGTVIVSRTASVGFSGIMAVPMATSQDYVNWVCGPKIRPEYLLYVFRSMRPEFCRLVMGSTHQTIYMPDVNSFQTPVPPIEEQERIVAHIRKASERVRLLLGRIRDGIARLQEYRTALISAAVTGQIDVRGEVTS